MAADRSTLRSVRIEVPIFFVRELSGYKAGALNHALAETDMRAKIVGVVDSDYLISPNYLSDLVHYF